MEDSIEKNKNLKFNQNNINKLYSQTPDNHKNKLLNRQISCFTNKLDLLSS